MMGFFKRLFGVGAGQLGAGSSMVAVVYKTKRPSKNASQSGRYRVRLCRRDDLVAPLFNQSRFNTSYESALELADETGLDVVVVDVDESDRR